MTIDDKIRDEILQYGICKEAAKISAWSSEKKWLIWISDRWTNTNFGSMKIGRVKLSDRVKPS